MSGRLRTFARERVWPFIKFEGPVFVATFVALGVPLTIAAHVLRAPHDRIDRLTERVERLEKKG